MKILVLSDTHGHTEKAEKAIRANKGIELMIHLGDHFRDAQKLSALFPGIPTEYVCGNCDFSTDGVPADKLIEVCGKKIFMTHGHRYSVKWDYDRLVNRAREQDADILLFGHTHIPELIISGRLHMLNPGSISDPRAGSDASYAVIEIDSGRIRPRICSI